MTKQTTGPMSPDEIDALKTTRIPEEVFEAFNEAIADKWNGSSATVKQDEVARAAVKKLRARLPDATLDTLYTNNWLDIENAYQKKGYTVEYDKPGYCESYDAVFIFRRRRVS